MRREQGVVGRVPDDRLERTGGLRPDRGRLVIDRARTRPSAVICCSISKVEPSSRR
jgi:hypothetical protein